MHFALKQEFETTNAQGKGPEMKAVQVTHQHLPTNQKTSGGVLTGAAAAATLALESAKDAISRN
ncbi:hypothetical protein J1N35_036300 [Gossypium stocksii]|uniref:Uncharacterized protein n=1 Tax=Gossypium stocksii TaxID=47602 RepID=A0A9D3UHV4_9ROSI|nr:hypothetical protein J1N35_036300 [Gossypium stocksii]